MKGGLLAETRGPSKRVLAQPRRIAAHPWGAIAASMINQDENQACWVNLFILMRQKQTEAFFSPEAQR